MFCVVMDKELATYSLNVDLLASLVVNSFDLNIDIYEFDRIFPKRITFNSVYSYSPVISACYSFAGLLAIIKYQYYPIPFNHRKNISV